MHILERLAISNLEIFMMMFRYPIGRCLLITFLLFIDSVQALELCNYQTNRELEACAYTNFKTADKDLNRQYADAIRSVSQVDKEALLTAQRRWIVYKENYCPETFDAIRDGEEAGIEKWSCLQSVTEMRTRELRYLSQLGGMVEFRKALFVMASLYENDDSEKVLSKLVAHVPQSTHPDWIKYVEANCKLTASTLHEEHDYCVARLNFYKNWW
ncbi:lysozyme inhibitor LprI family protein [Paraburkholderia sp. D15]|uniref:lysozyme inhibitor LprI family protein n=1 Tax=Paraburkholderia sp. D15 TaxID=2880218 RepID=UPI00247AB996|nr:lysozyme inhibitor LprI family protein [Paraburkholderia sp. D15]WGS54701.1 lysozyme inhibitor LprI family protein [Paraburkholderia sp. D15]